MQLAGLEPPCLADGCGAPGGLRCDYVDRRSRACLTTWCAAHWRIAHGKPYCRRHASLVTTLGGRPPAGGWPDLDNHAASLTGWMGRELDPLVTDVLTRVAPEGGAWMVNDPVHLVLAPGGAVRRWQRAWKLVDQGDVLNRVAIEVDERDDTDVLARVDTELVGHGTPPWIEARVCGWDVTPEEDEARRRRYLDDVARSIELVVTRQELVPLR
jgi:hypothetical protein